MERHGSIEWKRNASTKEMEWKQHKKRRKGLILFSNYLSIMILWKDMVQSNGKGTRQRKKWNGNNTRNVVKV